MLLAGAGSGLLEYTLLLVSCMSEQSPFLLPRDKEEVEGEGGAEGEGEEEAEEPSQPEEEKELKNQWRHELGDCVARLVATGAFVHAGKGAGGATEAAAGKAFCEANGLNFTVMSRVVTLRKQLQRVIDMRLGTDSAKGGAVLPPPNRLEQLKLSQVRASEENASEKKKRAFGSTFMPPPPPPLPPTPPTPQVLASGMLDQVAKRASNGEVVEASGVVRRDAYVSCSGSIKTPLYLSPHSALYERDWKALPDFVVYESVVKKERKGKDVNVMQNVARVEANWLCELAKDSPLLTEGRIMPAPEPVYDKKTDSVMCCVEMKCVQAPPPPTQPFPAP